MEWDKFISKPLMSLIPYNLKVWEILKMAKGKYKDNLQVETHRA